MGQVDREFKKDIKDLYKQFMQASSCLTRVHLFDMMASLSNDLGLNVIDEEEREDLLYYGYLYTMNNTMNKLPSFIVRINDLTIKIKREMIRHQLWDIEEGEISAKDVKDDEELSEEDRIKLIESKRG